MPECKHVGYHYSQTNKFCGHCGQALEPQCVKFEPEEDKSYFVPPYPRIEEVLNRIKQEYITEYHANKNLHADLTLFPYICKNCRKTVSNSPDIECTHCQQTKWKKRKPLNYFDKIFFEEEW